MCIPPPPHSRAEGTSLGWVPPKHQPPPPPPPKLLTAHSKPPHPLKKGPIYPLALPPTSISRHPPFAPLLPPPQTSGPPPAPCLPPEAMTWQLLRSLLGPRRPKTETTGFFFVGGGEEEEKGKRGQQPTSPSPPQNSKPPPPLWGHQDPPHGGCSISGSPKAMGGGLLPRWGSLPPHPPSLPLPQFFWGGLPWALGGGGTLGHGDITGWRSARRPSASGSSGQ